MDKSWRGEVFFPLVEVVRVMSPNLHATYLPTYLTLIVCTLPQLVMNAYMPIRKFQLLDQLFLSSCLDGDEMKRCSFPIFASARVERDVLKAVIMALRVVQFVVLSSRVFNIVYIYI